MRKKLLAMVMAGILCLANVAMVYADDDLSVQNNGDSISASSEMGTDEEDSADDSENALAEDNSEADHMAADSTMSDGAEEIVPAEEDETASSGVSGSLTWSFADGTLTISGAGDMEDYSSDKTPWSGYVSEINTVVLSEGITSIGTEAFRNCKALTEISIPESLVSVGNAAFRNCTGLTEITLPAKVTSIGNFAFYGCSGLTRINIPEGVTSIKSSTFYGCSSLQEITIPEGVTSIQIFAFYRCSSLTEITLPKSLSFVGRYAFDTCSSLADVYYNGSASMWNEVEIEDDNGSLTSANIHYQETEEDEKEKSGTCGSALTWSYADGILTISGYGNMHNYSSNDSSPWADFNDDITSVNLPEGIISIGSYAFKGCSNLSEINIPEGVTSIGSHAFKGCSNLSEINIPEGVTSIGYNAFDGCSSLREITIPEGVTRVNEWAFYGCSNLSEINIPEGVTSIGSNAFSDCSSLREITIPESVANIFDAAFSGCSSLKEVILPEGITHITTGLFCDCSSLTNVSIPESVTQISEYAFARCVSLSEINLPGGIKTFEVGGILDCSNLTDIYYDGTEEMWSAVTIKNIYGLDPNPLDSVTIHFKDSSDEESTPAHVYNDIDYSAVYDFDYFHANSDVAEAFGDDDEATLENFIQWGMTTGRQGNEEFNVYIYMANYPELKETYGSNLASYYYHYIWWGKAAGLVANERLPHDPVTEQDGIDYSAVYDYEYFHANADVAEAFGDDDEATLANFVQWGITTGRQGNSEFNVYIYMANYPELKETYGSNLASYYYHYIWWGKAAGLVANERLPHDPVTEQDGIDYSAVYDYEYFHSNKDVADAFGDDDVATLANFVRWGMTTGRQGNEEFNVYIYMNNYPELKETYGSNLASYYYHYIWWGKAAGLVANEEI